MANGTKPAKPASVRQRDLILKLMEGRRTDGLEWAGLIIEMIRRWPDDWHTRLSSRQASSLLDDLFAAPRVPRMPPKQVVSAEVVPAGKYKVGDRLVRVDRPESGGWVGWVFVEDITHAAERLKRADADAVLTEIAAVGAEAAAAEYGKATGECGVCSRRLTDPVSVALGIGPICRKKF